MPGFSLYQLSDEYLVALDTLTQQDDIPPEAIADTLDGLAGEWEDKALNVARFIKNLEAEAAAINEAKKSMDAREKAASNKAMRLKDYLREQIDRTGLKPKAADICIKTQKNPASVVIVDEFDLPEDCIEIRETRHIDKGALKSMLQAGIAMNGARLDQSTRLVIQ